MGSSRGAYGGVSVLGASGGGGGKGVKNWAGNLRKGFKGLESTGIKSRGESGEGSDASDSVVGE